MIEEPSNNPQPQPDQSQTQPPSARRSRNQPQPKKPKIPIAIKPEQFEQEKGLKALYEKTKAIKLDEASEINVENSMKKIVLTLKSWHNEFIPKYTYDHFLQRCQALGTSKFLLVLQFIFRPTCQRCEGSTRARISGLPWLKTKRLLSLSLRAKSRYTSILPCRRRTSRPSK
jgi:hypothetical protein